MLKRSALGLLAVWNVSQVAPGTRFIVFLVKKQFVEGWLHFVTEVLCVAGKEKTTVQVYIYMRIYT